MSIKVAVRVRPFNQREKDLGAILCIQMNGQTTAILDERGAPREFSFDYSFWSHDRFESNEEGYNYPIDGKYSDQRYVFDTLGKDILENAWQGYHCCLFAYGQTGAGKSYSMVGAPGNKGIVPISAEEIFRRIDSGATPNISYEVTVSMLEIYNEKVQDLLIRQEQRPSGGLRIRESKVAGVFVDGLSRHPVANYEEIEHLMDVGNTNRSIGATQMNASSSRAHTITTIELRQVDSSTGLRQEKLSVINLVDLAGSEKAGQTGATGDRLKEGCAINKSLTVLGTVIEKLADRSTGKNPNVVVPYREAALTRILSNALGGNSKTVMICALSPASSNYEETLSTLRYADRAKKIKNHAVVNESVQDKLIRELRLENERLRKLLEAGGLEKMGPAEKLEQIEELEANEIFLTQQMQPWSEQIRQTPLPEIETNDFSIPHLININEDHQLSGKVYYNFLTWPLLVGKRCDDESIRIQLSGPGIQKLHCVFKLDKVHNVTLDACSMLAADYLFVNGEKVRGTRVLKHLDRIIIGTNTVFLFKYPERSIESSIEESAIDYEFILQEKMEHETGLINDQLEQIKSQYDKQIEELKEEIARLQSEKVSQPTPPPQPTAEAQVEHRAKTQKVMRQKLATDLPLVNEANLISDELQKQTIFAPKILNILPRKATEENLNSESWEKRLCIEVMNYEYQLVYLWDMERFENRLNMMRELMDEYRMTERLPQISPESDPYWDPPEEQLIGVAYYSLRPLGLLFDNPFDLRIVSTPGGEAGNLRVNIVPIDDYGNSVEDGPESPEELIGSTMSFRVEVIEAWGLPAAYANNVSVRYEIFTFGEESTGIVTHAEENGKFRFNYQREYHAVTVTEEMCAYMQKYMMWFEVRGTGKTVRPPSVDTTPTATSRTPNNNVSSISTGPPSRGSTEEGGASGTNKISMQASPRAASKPAAAAKKGGSKKECQVF